MAIIFKLNEGSYISRNCQKTKGGSSIYQIGSEYIMLELKKFKDKPRINSSIVLTSL